MRGQQDSFRYYEMTLSVRSADAALAPTGMETLHGFEVLTIHVGFPKTDFLKAAFRLRV